VCASAGGAGGAGGSGATSAGGSGGSGAGSSAGGSGGSGVSGSGGTGGSGAGGVGGADPSAPIVEIPGLPCGGVIDANLASPFVELGGRQVFVDYACGKARGTPVTFILNLHGTMAQESGRHYIRGYFPTHQYTDSHNLIIATPKSVVSQWGNQDGGQDEPHVMAVIDWMYETFAGFDIRQMWIVGHSWGAMYARTFACKTELTDKVHGVVLMSGGSSMPACADRLAALGTVGETDIVPGELNQGAAASAHACAAQTTLTLGNNRVTHWPSCGPGWVHKNYFMLGKGHGFSPVDWPDSGMNDDMVAAIVSTR
jgi:pimeloyl-ACP methyl ester carboxylesterase